MGRTTPQCFTHVAGSLEAAAIREGGDVAFQAFALEEVLPLLGLSPHLVGIPAEIDRVLLCRQAAADAARAGPVTDVALDQALAACAGAFRAQAHQPVLLVTTLSVRRPAELDRRTVGSWELRFYDSPPHRLESLHPREVLTLEAVQARERGPWVFARGTARSGAEAGLHALEHIDALRGAWNLGINARLFAEFFGLDYRPVNTIRLGPLHTLHESGGDLRISQWWYDPFPFAPELLGQVDANWEQAFAGERRVEPALRSQGVGELLRGALVRYARALDNADPELMFFRLWGVLERLAGSHRDPVLLRRVPSVFWTPELDVAHFRLLRSQRHASAHRAEESFLRRRSVIALHRFVVRLFGMLIDNHADCSSPRKFFRIL